MKHTPAICLGETKAGWVSRWDQNIEGKEEGVGGGKTSPDLLQKKQQQQKKKRLKHEEPAFMV